MNTLTIPKNEYDLLNQQALAYKKLVSRLFEFVIKDSEENLVDDFRRTDLYSEEFLHPSLNVELLEPKWRGIYSFRLDLKYRALFFIEKAKLVLIFILPLIEIPKSLQSSVISQTICAINVM